MALVYASQAPNRQQWELNSQYSQSWNCGPSCVAFILGYHKGGTPGIEYRRKTIAGMGPYVVTGTGTYYGCPARTPTNSTQQRDMLRRGGLSSTVAKRLDTVAQLHSIVDSNRRPIIIGIQMGRVPWQVRGHNFTGWHAIVVICRAVVNGVTGFWIMDPNFPAGSSKSRRFYSDAVMRWAWEQNEPQNCVVPPAKALATTAPIAPSRIEGMPVTFKPIEGRGTIKASKPRRAGPSTTATNYGTIPASGFPLWAEVVGEDMGKYGLPGGKRWFVGPNYVGGKYRVCYIPYADFSKLTIS